MEQKSKKAALQFKNYLIDQCSFSFKNVSISKEMEFSITPEVSFDKDKHSFELLMNVAINDKEHYLDINMRIRGFFDYSGEDTNLLRNFIGINAPAILFPYIRSYISNITALGGIQPVIMPTLNMTAVGNQLLNSISL